MGVNNGSLVEMSQNGVPLVTKLMDNLDAVSIGYGANALCGDVVKVPVVSFGAASSATDYNTAGSNSITLVNIQVEKYTKGQWDLTEAEYSRFGEIITQRTFNTFVENIGKEVTDAVYGLANTTNFPYSGNSVATGVAEAGLTLAAIYSAVGKVIDDGVFAPANIKVVTPHTTYLRLRAELDARYRDTISAPFSLVPSTKITNTFICDGSWAAVAIGADPGTNKQAFVEPNSGIGYTLKVWNTDETDKMHVAVRYLYGVALLGGSIRWLRQS